MPGRSSFGRCQEAGAKTRTLCAEGRGSCHATAAGDPTRGHHRRHACYVNERGNQYQGCQPAAVAAGFTALPDEDVDSGIERPSRRVNVADGLEPENALGSRARDVLAGNAHEEGDGVWMEVKRGREGVLVERPPG